MYKNLFLLCVSLLAMLGLCEGVLRYFTVFPITSSSNKVFDERLLYRTSPKAEGVDVSGFRNAKSAGPYELVALGDSHTFGYNVKARSGWPALVGHKLGMHVSNMSAGGYSLLQYAALMEDAVALKPKLIVVGLFAYNDFLLSCDVLALPYWQQKAAELQLAVKGCEGAGHAEPPPSRRFVEQFAVTSAVDYLWHAKRDKSVTRWLEPDSTKPQLPTLSRDEKLENGRRIFAYMQHMAQAQGIRLVVLLIPSRTLVENPKAPGGQEAERIAEETQLRNGIMAAFGEMGIEYVDALPLTQAKYQAATRENTAFYGGSHPFEAGYAAYAKSLLLYLEKAPAGPETH